MARTKTKQKSKTRSKAFSIGKEKLFSVLRKKSFTAVMECFWILFKAASNKTRVRVGLKLEKAANKPKAKRKALKRRASKGKTPKRKTAKRKSKAKKSNGRKKPRTAKQKRIILINMKTEFCEYIKKTIIGISRNRTIVNIFGIFISNQHF